MVKNRQQNRKKIFLKFMFVKTLFYIVTFFLFLRKRYIGYPHATVENLLINC